MLILKSAKKALRSSLKKRQVNLKIKKRLKKYVSLFKKNPTKKSLSQAFSILDKAAKKKVIKKQKASRLKSRFSAFLKRNLQKTKTAGTNKSPKKKI